MRKLFVVLTAVVALTAASKIMVSWAADEAAATSDTAMKMKATTNDTMNGAMNDTMNETNAMVNDANAMANEAMNETTNTEANGTK